LSERIGAGKKKPLKKRRKLQGLKSKKGKKGNQSFLPENPVNNRNLI